MYYLFDQNYSPARTVKTYKDEDRAQAITDRDNMNIAYRQTEEGKNCILRYVLELKHKQKKDE